MVNLMEKKNYDLTQITRVLLEIRDNCVPKDGEAYDDPKRMEKYDALKAAIDLINNPSQLVTGDTSDGYHTFNELYHHRAVLFSVIVKAFKEKAWKARLHHDGTMYDGMFIVGIDTPEGQASYHYDIDPYWDMFECRELERAPEWDGHTPAQAIERIGKLEPVQHGRWIQSKTVPYYHYCSRCGVHKKWKSRAIFMFLNHIAHTAARKWTEAKTMKTPDKIKKGLEIVRNGCMTCECCSTDCPYDLECYPTNKDTNADMPKQMAEDALAYIQQLENHIGELTEKVEQLEAAQPK